MTDTEFILWVQSSDAKVCVLAEVVASIASSETTLYLSNLNYTEPGTSSPVSYKHRIVGGCVITEELSLDGRAGMAFSDIEVDNLSGDLDEWLTYIWTGRSCLVYVGDISWPKSQFRLVFSGVIDDVGSRNKDVLNIKIRDKLQRLNAPLSDTKLGGTSINKDRLIPYCFGEVYNVEPLLVDKATLEYQVNGGQIERIIEVRDNGVPVEITQYLSTGKFRLNARDRGQLTVSVQGEKPSVYRNSISSIVQRIVTTYGTDRFSSDDLDIPNLTAFDIANPQPVGIYLSDRANVLEVCQKLAASVGAQLVMSAEGLLRLLKIQLPAAGPSTSVTKTNIEFGTLELKDRVPIQASVKIGFCQNYTVQANLQTGIPAEHKALHAKEWMTATSKNDSVAAAYKKFKEPEQQDTCLLSASDAQSEADRRLALWSVQRQLFQYTGFPELLLEQLGGAQTITHDRFNLSGGVSGQIVSIAKDWLSLRVQIGVLV